MPIDEDRVTKAKMSEQNKRQRAMSRDQELKQTKTSEGAHASVKAPLSFNWSFAVGYLGPAYYLPQVQGARLAALPGSSHTRAPLTSC